jgi:hypothetical protein
MSMFETGDTGCRATTNVSLVQVSFLVSSDQATWLTISLIRRELNAEAVDALLFAGLASTREEAVEFGKTLQKELRLFRCATGDESFKDGFVFYRLRSEEKGCDASIRTDGSRSLIGGQGDSKTSHSYPIHANLVEKSEAFKKIVDAKERTYHMRKYQNVFVGCEAVDALVYNGIANTRSEAVQLGRAIARELNLFKHVTGDHAFSDGFLFYEFNGTDVSTAGSILDNSISTGNSRLGISDLSRRKGRLAAEAEEFKNCLDIRDRKYRIATYKECFIGSEAVDAMLFGGMAKTRAEAVELGRKLERELRLFQHVLGDYAFCDEQYFYRLRESSINNNSDSVDCDSFFEGASRDDSSEGSDLTVKVDAFRRIVGPLVQSRKYHMRTYNSVFVGQEAVDALVYSGFAKTRKEVVQVGRELAKQYGLFSHVSGDHALCDDFLFFKFRDSEDFGEPVDCENQSKVDSTLSINTRGELGEQADLFRGCVDVRDRAFRMIKYKACFIGSEAVDAMVFTGLAESRKDAAKLAKLLVKELRLFSAVNGTDAFEDEYTFFRFRSDEDISSSNQSRSSETDTASHTSLLSMADAFKECAEVKDRRYRFKTYKQCFIGCGKYYCWILGDKLLFRFLNFVTLLHHFCYRRG